MANNPTTNKQLNRPDYNDQNWNTPLNNDFTIIDQCLGTSLTPSQTSTNTYALTSTDIQNMRLNLGGTLTATGTATVPATYGGFWIVSNNTTGGYTINFKVATGSNNVNVKNGYTTIIFSNGTECYEAVDQKLNVTGGTITGNLSVNNGTLALQSASVTKLSYDPTAGTPNLSVTGTITATSNITAFSDVSLKTNIRPIEDAVFLTNKLRGVYYLDQDKKQRIGVIAQEVDQVFPEVVLKDEKSGLLSVDYGNLVAVLINANKELANRVSHLENVIDGLKVTFEAFGNGSSK